MKTIFVSIISGVEAKNLLRTNVISALVAREDIRVVLFVRSHERIAFYEKEFSHSRLAYEVAPDAESGRMWRYFERLRHYLVNTRSQKLYKTLAYQDRRNLIAYIASNLASATLAHRAIRRLVRALEMALVRDDPFAPYFEKYKPDRVFLANLFDGTEVDLLRGAKRRGISSVGFINSWDKVTSKGFVRLLPDILLVPNNLVRDESVALLDVAPQKTVVVGLPQYDMYASRDGLLPREVFFQRIGFDPAKKLVVVAPAGSSYGTTDRDIVNLLASLGDKGALKHPFSLIVRFQPNDFVERAGFPERSWIRYESPGTRFAAKRGMDWDMNADELMHLKNTLAHADLFITYGSSIGIDASIYDKPVVMVGFEINPDKPHLDRPSLRYGTEHITKALAPGGMWLVKNSEELALAINEYFEAPAHDREGRQKLVAEQCGEIDGMAGERIARAILAGI